MVSTADPDSSLRRQLLRAITVVVTIKSAVKRPCGGSPPRQSPFCHHHPTPARRWTLGKPCWNHWRDGMGEPLVIAAIELIVLLTTRKTAASPETSAGSCAVFSTTNAMSPLAVLAS